MGTPKEQTWRAHPQKSQTHIWQRNVKIGENLASVKRLVPK